MQLLSLFPFCTPFKGLKKLKQKSSHPLQRPRNYFFFRAITSSSWWSTVASLALCDFRSHLLRVIDDLAHTRVFLYRPLHPTLSPTLRHSSFILKTLICGNFMTLPLENWIFVQTLNSDSNFHRSTDYLKYFHWPLFKNLCFR